jgi:UDP-3-O-acyl-N-acetylglucosamine deacetylase
MPDEKKYGSVLKGSENEIRHAYGLWMLQPVDQEIPCGDDGMDDSFQTTVREPVSVSGPGTFFGNAQRTLTFLPSREPGWFLDRGDLVDSLPIKVSVDNVWTTVRNIVLRSGSPHNYIRMVEHIVALKAGMGLDNVVIKADSGDPPLSDRSSMDLVDAVERVGLVCEKKPAVFLTVREPVTIGGPGGSFLTFLPASGGSRKLSIDCAIASLQ